MASTGIFLTNTITKLELFCLGNCIGTATGFFLRIANGWSLITNWHVLSGRDQVSKKPRHPMGALPDKCRFSVARKDHGLVWNYVECQLGDMTSGTATWLEHPEHRGDVDIACLPLGNIELPLARDLLANDGNDPDMFIDLGGEVFLPGFPLGISANGLMPIWKRASLASSLEFGHSIEKFFFVDTATREGMSGSPCLAISNWRHYSMDRRTNKVRVVERPLSWRFLGVYSGRRNPSDSFEAQIGLVWREQLAIATANCGIRARLG